MGLNYSKGPVPEDRNSEWPDEEPPPWVTTLKSILHSAGRILCSIARASYHLFRGIFYSAYCLLQGLYHVCEGVFYSIRGLIYFLVGFFGKQGTAVILASLAIVGVGYYIYTKDPNFAHQHVQIIENKSTQFVQEASSRVGSFMNKNSSDFSSKIGDVSSKLGDVTSKVGDFASESKKNVWTKFDWSK